VALNNPASSTQAIPGYDYERHLTREKHFHIHRACLGTAARPHSSVKHAPLQGAEKIIDLGRIFLFFAPKQAFANWLNGDFYFYYLYHTVV